MAAMTSKMLSVVTLLILVFIGLSNAIYLATMTKDGEIPLCTVDGLDGCGAVYTSPYSLLFGIPLSYLGVLYFAGMFAISLLLFFIPFHFFMRLSLLGAFFGIILSLYFVYVQVFIINALCAYCLFSAALTILIGGVVYAIQPPFFRVETLTQRH
jgi:uncharacterized membrane protein